MTGESGTGKELVARALHAASPRRHQRLVAVNCGAIPDSLLESQLFGHVRGAFTSAVQANPGLFVAAHGGTLFLDEIGELPVALQAKLLRVHRGEAGVGGRRDAAAAGGRAHRREHQPRPAGEIEAGRFRADLFYRLNVVHVVLPPLRERPEDIPILVDHLVRRLNPKLHRRVLGVEPEALHALLAYEWKGNVRELDHVLEQAMILGDGDISGCGTCGGSCATARRRRDPWTCVCAVRPSPGTTSSTCWPDVATTSGPRPAFSGSASRPSTGS